MGKAGEGGQREQAPSYKINSPGDVMCRMGTIQLIIYFIANLEVANWVDLNSSHYKKKNYVTVYGDGC